MDKKRPVRTCVGCRTSGEKKDFVRIVKDATGNVIIDADGKAQGRGAYICKNPDCLKKVMKSKALERALKCAIASEVYDRLEVLLHDAKTE